MSFLKVRSWHTISRVDDTGWHTRCGLTVNDSAPASDHIPLDEPSCETCLRLDLHDAEKQDVVNDEVVE